MQRGQGGRKRMNFLFFLLSFNSSSPLKVSESNVVLACAFNHKFLSTSFLLRTNDDDDDDGVSHTLSHISHKFSIPKGRTSSYFIRCLSLSYMRTHTLCFTHTHKHTHSSRVGVCVCVHSFSCFLPIFLAISAAHVLS